MIVLGGIASFGLLISWLGVEVGLTLAAALIAFVSWRWGRDSRDFQDSTSSVARR